MNDSIKKIALDVHSSSSSVAVNVKKGDTGRTIHISLVDGGLPYQITEDCYAVFTAKNPEGNVVINACTIENNVIIYKMTRQATSVVGRLNCEIELYGADDNLITAPKFVVIVDGKVYNDGDAEADEDEVSTLAGLIQDAATAIAGANTAASNADKVAQDLELARDNGEFVGEQGPIGPQGPVGPQGAAGPQGAIGPQGPQGEKGDKGDKGDAGSQGPKGDKGDAGPQGPAGATGPRGATGATGPQGPAGADGAKGDKGDPGAPGADGEDGITPEFSIGSVTTLGAGSKAFATITGTKEKPVLNLGIPKGADGSGGGGTGGGTGADGEDGGYYIPSLNSAGDLSWTATKSDMPDVQTVNIKGEKGEPGAKGDKGDKGDTGATGAAGYNPVRGKDYWTSADIAEIQSYVDEAILGGEW